MMNHSVNNVWSVCSIAMNVRVGSGIEKISEHRTAKRVSACGICPRRRKSRLHNKTVPISKFNARGIVSLIPNIRKAKASMAVQMGADVLDVKLYGVIPHVWCKTKFLAIAMWM